MARKKIPSPVSTGPVAAIIAVAVVLGVSAEAGPTLIRATLEPLENIFGAPAVPLTPVAPLLLPPPTLAPDVPSPTPLSPAPTPEPAPALILPVPSLLFPVVTPPSPLNNPPWGTDPSLAPLCNAVGQPCCAGVCAFGFTCNTATNTCDVSECSLSHTPSREGSQCTPFCPSNSACPVNSGRCSAGLCMPISANNPTWGATPLSFCHATNEGMSCPIPCPPDTVCPASTGICRTGICTGPSVNNPVWPTNSVGPLTGPLSTGPNNPAWGNSAPTGIHSVTLTPPRPGLVPTSTHGAPSGDPGMIGAFSTNAMQWVNGSNVAPDIQTANPGQPLDGVPNALHSLQFDSIAPPQPSLTGPTMGNGEGDVGGLPNGIGETGAAPRSQITESDLQGVQNPRILEMIHDVLKVINNLRFFGM